MSAIPLRPGPASTHRPTGTPALVLLLACLTRLILPPPAFAQTVIPVEGITDQSVTADHVTFRVPPAAAGFTLTATLDGTPVAVGTPVEVNTPDYHELLLRRLPVAGGAPETRLVRFIVRASERGNSEWGLPPWTPPPILPGTPEELAGARLRVIVPDRFPAGMPIPLVAWLDGPGDHALRANAQLTSPAHPPIWIRRGAGAGSIPAPTNTPTLAWIGRVPGQEVAREIQLEAAPAWTPAGGTLGASVTWPPNSRIDVTRSVTVPVGATLTIEAGTVVRLAAGADFLVQGQLRVRGRAEQPVAFVPASPGSAWGGFVVRGSSARFDASHGLFTGSGANPNWFDQNSGYDVHRHEQALFLVDDNAHVELADCAAFDGRGQFGHGRNGFLTLTRSLVQRFITGGEYNGGGVTLRDAALLEFPADDGVFADEDNDAIYLTTGQHVIADTVIGWAKDDGIDSGSGGAGTVLATNVWVDSNFHEAFAWSGAGRVVTNLHCVAFRCGQGIECGWSTGDNSPRVQADDCLSLANASGLRFGDNYDWTYNGFLRVTRSLVLHNYRDVFDRNWDDWSPRPAQLDLRGNRFTRALPDHPDNAVWLPTTDGALLRDFVNTPAGAPVGVGFAHRGALGALGVTPARVPLALGTFAAHPVSVEYAVEAPAGLLVTGRERFEPGETLRLLQLPPIPPDDFEMVRVRLVGAEGGRITGADTFYLRRAGSAPVGPLIPAGSEWRYHDLGTDPGAGWTMPDFADAAWKSGRAELGYGDGDEVTTIASGPSGARFPAAYFRHAVDLADPSRLSELEIRFRRDDGGIVHLNGLEVFRSNMPAGPITHTTYAASGTASETEFYVQRIPASRLRPGRNVVAVEVHQAGASSSDLSFDLELVAVPVPRLDWWRFGTDLVLGWDDPALRLQEAPGASGPWAGLESGQTTAVVRPDSPRFYRLVRSP